MPSGLLRVEGTFDIQQFWPDGMSDADTVKIKIGASAFAFRPHAGAAFRDVSVAFDGAKVKGRVTKPVIGNGTVTIRLQASTLRSCTTR